MPRELPELDTLVEGDEIEAKAAQGRHGQGVVPRSVWETYSSFANTRGGHILLGVLERDDGSFDYVGVPDPERLADAFWREVCDPGVVSANILSRADVRVVAHRGARFVVVRVPRATRAQRPVFVGSDPYHGTYVRLDDGDHRVPRHVVDFMIYN
jgi:predicted HTH transcriptional regulator